MSRSDLDAAFELIAEREDEADFEGAKPQALVQAAERALGLELPAMYREFLLRLGAGDIAGEEFYGVIDDDFESSSVPDAVWLTLQERRSGLPEPFVIVGAVGDGAWYVLDTSAGGEAPVVVWQPGAEEPERVADDFGAFFRQRLEEAL